MSTSGESIRETWVRAQDVVVGAWSRAGDLIDQVLDRVFDEPYNVPDAAAARRLLSSRSNAPPAVVPEFVIAAVVMRLGRWVPRMSRFGGLTTTAAVAATARVGQVVQRGLLELRVLASLLAHRARAIDVDMDKALVRAVTIELYLDPLRRVDHKYRGARAGRALAARWIRNAVSPPSDIAERAEERIRAVENLDLRRLTEDGPLSERSILERGT